MCIQREKVKRPPPPPQPPRVSIWGVDGRIFFWLSAWHFPNLLRLLKSDYYSVRNRFSLRIAHPPPPTPVSIRGVDGRIFFWLSALAFPEFIKVTNDTQPHGSVRTGHFPGIFRLREDYFRVSNSKSLHNHLTVTRQQQIITAHDPSSIN